MSETPQAHYSSLITRHSLLYSLLITHYSLLITRYPYLMPHAPCLMPHTSYLMPHASCLIPHTSYLIPLRRAWRVPSLLRCTAWRGRAVRCACAAQGEASS